MRPPVDIPAVIRQIVELEELHRARRRLLTGMVLAPLSCWFAVTRFHPDWEWSTTELMVVTPMLLLSAGLVALGLAYFLRRLASGKRG